MPLLLTSSILICSLLVIGRKGLNVANCACLNRSPTRMPQIGIAVLLIRDYPVHTFTVPSITFLLLLAVAKTAKPAF
jgi:hypothetical protein